MRRIMLAAVAAAVLATGPPEADGQTARQIRDADCTAYCGDLAARRCDDVTSNRCNAYIIGCLAGCGIAHL